MNPGFHEKPFHDATRIKLEIFRQYIREWLPVFLTQSHASKYWTGVNVYDFFSGPGHDRDGNPGSPLIIQEEIKAFCAERGQIKSDVPVRMIFNDLEKRYISNLKEVMEGVKCGNGCCSFEFTCAPFKEVLQEYIPKMKSPGQANLVIMDQFGIKEVTPDIIKEILDAGTTDILFFISSAFVRRFAETPEFKNFLDIDGSEIKSISYNVIHRYLCDRFRASLDSDKAMLAPFSIKRGANIYGVIFGSQKELGMEKFLKVCWGLDNVTGEANYNIDNEVTWAGQLSLFDEDNVPTKEKVFEKELSEFISKHQPTNRQVWRFALEHGFHSVKCGTALKSLQASGAIEITDIKTSDPARKGAFYLTRKTDCVRFKGRT